MGCYYIGFGSLVIEGRMEKLVLCLLLSVSGCPFVVSLGCSVMHAALRSSSTPGVGVASVQQVRHMSPGAPSSFRRY